MDFKLENLVCEAGKKISGFWNIEGYSIPTTIINGEKEGKVIAISSEYIIANMWEYKVLLNFHKNLNQKI